MEGLIERNPGIGTRVIQAPLRIGIAFSPDTAKLDVVGTQVRVIESVLVTGSAEVCAKLDLPPESLVLRNTRLRETKDGVPLRLLISYIPEALSKDLSYENIGGATMVELLSRAGHVAAGATDVIGATLAEPSVARHLNTKAGAPLVQVDRLAVDANGKPIMHQVNLFSPESHRIIIEVRATDTGLPYAGAPGYLIHST
jgi:GntR family transcriptional regulator